MRNGHLPAYLGWKAYLYKLWISIKHGLGVMTNDTEEVEHLFDKIDYNMMNIIGVASTIKTGSRKLHSTFEGIGLLNLKDEQMIERFKPAATALHDWLHSQQETQYVFGLSSAANWLQHLSI